MLKIIEISEFRINSSKISLILTPFVVEARGRLGSEVLSFLRQHAPEEEPLRSAVLARATREISIITQRGLAALLLSAEPRPAMV